jgi:hypothetical protein
MRRYYNRRRLGLIKHRLNPVLTILPTRLIGQGLCGGQRLKTGFVRLRDDVSMGCDRVERLGSGHTVMALDLVKHRHPIPVSGDVVQGGVAGLHVLDYDGAVLPSRRIVS